MARRKEGRSVDGSSSAVEPANQIGRPPEEEIGNSEALTEALRSLGISEEEEASRRLVLRVARMLRTARKKVGLAQDKLAEGAGLTQNYVSKLESRDMARGPTLDVLARYAHALDCDVAISLRNKSTGEVIASAESGESAYSGVANDFVSEVACLTNAMVCAGAYWHRTQTDAALSREVTLHFDRSADLHTHNFVTLANSLSEMTRGFTKSVTIVAKPQVGYPRYSAGEVTIGKIKPRIAKQQGFKRYWRILPRLVDLDKKR